MALISRLFARTYVERVISAVRVALAAACLFGIWLDPNEPNRFTEVTYSLYVSYVLYSVALAGVAWTEWGARQQWLPLATHVTDICIASLFQYLTFGPSSPFFTFFTFALFGAALRWGSKGTIRTAVSVMAAFVAITVSLSGTLTPEQFDVNRFVIRGVYLVVVAIVLVYLSKHEERVQGEIRQLARWPSAVLKDEATAVPQLLEHSARIVGAGGSTMVWSKDDEPWLYLASWPFRTIAIERIAPAQVEPMVAGALAAATFLSRQPFDEQAKTDVSCDGSVGVWQGGAVNARLQSRLGLGVVASTPFKTDSVSGRVFFMSFETLTVDVLPLLEIVGREIGTSMDQIYAYERAREFAIVEDRLKVARDLHDGVLQSLTGIRLELQDLAQTRASADASTGDRLLGIERALALEQRELRRFIDGLKPAPEGGEPVTLDDRLEDIRHRVGLEWRTPISIRLDPESLTVPRHLTRAVPLMVHEAIVNALKHGHPTHVAVSVQARGETLFITVDDNGSGFSFAGRRDQHVLTATRTGPISLRERVASLGGQIVVESTPAGAHIEVSIPVGAAPG
jgi:signal transduction histidine kinase